MVSNLTKTSKSSQGSAREGPSEPPPTSKQHTQQPMKPETEDSSSSSSSSSGNESSDEEVLSKGKRKELPPPPPVKKRDRSRSPHHSRGIKLKYQSRLHTPKQKRNQKSQSKSPRRGDRCKC